MDTITLTVYFEDPFWVGVVEWLSAGELRAARQIFGGEPSPGEVHEFVLRDLARLLDRPAVALEVAPVPARAPSPKRAAREAARTVSARGASTRSQQALQLQLEQHKRERQRHSRAERDAEAERRRQIKLQKAKARHRGR